jgi:nucleotide-binding universal stress UspA family protein
VGMTEIPSAAVRPLIACDGSSSADDAVRAAAQLFPGAEAVLLFVGDEPAALERAAIARIAVPDQVLVTAARAYERDALERAREIAENGRRLAEGAGLHATADVRTGASAWRVIAHAAEQFDADVIVCGSRGRGPFSRALLGSTSSSLLHQADRPVLIVPPGAGDLSGPTLLAYDGSDGARDAIATAARLLPGREAVVVHAWSSPLERSYVERSLSLVPLADAQELARDLEELFALHGSELADEGAERAREAGLAARAVTAEARAGTWRALTASARAEGASVIVAGHRGRGALALTVLGSVSAGLVHNAELPVLIVR